MHNKKLSQAPLQSMEIVLAAACGRQFAHLLSGQNDCVQSWRFDGIAETQQHEQQ